MSVALQPSLFDEPDQPARLGPLAGSVQRTDLGSGAWVDVRPLWVAGSDSLFERLMSDVPWQAERRWMYERVVDVPRLVCFYGDGEALPDPLLDNARDALSDHYRSELGEPFVTAGLCYYRNGDDSVAWHGDTHGRSSHEDTMVAILALGASRPLLLRPKEGGRSRRYRLGSGDLLVMGGSCQRTWEHSIPKLSHKVGPRISVQFRPHGVA